jgi:hypothetical protein
MQGRENKRAGSQSHELLLLLALKNIKEAITSDTEFQLQYLKDANGNFVWVEVNSIDGIKTYTYYDSPGGNIVTPAQPLQPISLGVDTELIEDEFIAVTTDLINGYSVGDQLSRISYFDLTGPLAPYLISTFWFNKTTSTMLTTVDLTDLEDQDGPVITITGAKTDVLSSDGTSTFSFDSDSIIIENFGTSIVTCIVDGILEGTILVAPNTYKRLTHNVAKMTEVAVSGISGGDVWVTYSRGK